MYLKNRLIRIISEENDYKAFKKLSIACKEESVNNKYSDNLKFLLEQKLENVEDKGKVRFSKVVEVWQYCKFGSNKISKLDELTSIAMDLKKDCGMGELKLKPSRNRFRRVDVKAETTKAARKKREFGATVRPRTQVSQPLKVKNLAQALDLAKKMNGTSLKNSMSLVAVRGKVVRKPGYLESVNF